MSDIPTCHACGGKERPFLLVLRGGWRHDPEHCNAVVCPACGAEPQPGDGFCSDCRALPYRTGVMPVSAARVPRGRHGR